MENQNNCFLAESFRSYRNCNTDNQSSFKNYSKDINNQKSFRTEADSAYYSSSSYVDTLNSFTSNLTASHDSQSLSPSTPTSSVFSSSKNSSSIKKENTSLETIFEHSISKKEAITLTPITQNAHRISAFHITTPKTGSNLKTEHLMKRSSNFLLDQYERTPKKFKYFDQDVYATPQKQKKKKSESCAFLRLHSAPDFQGTVKENDYNERKSPEKHKKIHTTLKRIPLQTIQSSTPIVNKSLLQNFSKKDLLLSPLNSVKENSVNVLLNCSDDAFHSILNSYPSLSSKRAKLSNSKNVTKNEPNLLLYGNSGYSEKSAKSLKSFRRFLKFGTNETITHIESRELNKDTENLKENIESTSFLTQSKTRPIIRSVVEDRINAKKLVKLEQKVHLSKPNNTANEYKILPDSHYNKIQSNTFHENYDELNNFVNTNQINMELSSPNSEGRFTEIKHLDTQYVDNNMLNKFYNTNQNTMHVLRSYSPHISSANIKQVDMEICTPKLSDGTADNNQMDMQLCSPNSEDISYNSFSMETLPAAFKGNNLNIEKNNEHNHFSFIKTNNNLNSTNLEFETNFIENSDEYVNFIPLTPPKQICRNFNQFEDVDIKPLDNYIENVTVLKVSSNKIETPPGTPLLAQKLSSMSSQKSSTICSSNTEKFHILYPKIPETPNKEEKLSPKKIKKLRELNANQLHTRRQYYNGITFLNILNKLEPYTIILDKIFHYLSDEDLLNLSMTTKVYRNLIKTNKKVNSRLTKFIENYKICKENHIKHTQKVENEKKSEKMYNKLNNSKNYKMKPFSLHNEKYLSRQSSLNELKSQAYIVKSPPVSPSKRKFHDYQKIIKTSNIQTNMAKCPRCSMASRIIQQPQTQSSPNISSKTKTEALIGTNKKKYEDSEMRQLSLMAAKSIDSTTSIATEHILINKSSGESKSKLMKAFSVDSWQGQLKKFEISSSEFQPYGECTSLRCKFKYCLECFCEYHPQQKCKLTQSISPSKEDIQDGILQICKSPKKSGLNAHSKFASKGVVMRRKSLKRLCFN